eukprot:TRINITY_DN8096_c1_g1_i1.p2 TRINITY_DN8096_c1_g1~~TRINITY_DN8096_c1_g1_i1.p2  ORF type:complete len:184 (+),score=6.16 TRINITY_DN8096_c1_g1_i1:199-750(+)
MEALCSKQERTAFDCIAAFGMGIAVAMATAAARQVLTTPRVGRRRAAAMQAVARARKLAERALHPITAVSPPTRTVSTCTATYTPPPATSTVGTQLSVDDIHAPTSIIVYAKRLSGATHTLWAEPTETLWSLKGKIYRKDTRVAQANLRVIYAGARLDDSRTLQCYGIGDRSTVHVIENLCGS